MSRSPNLRKRSQWLDRLSRFARSKLSVADFCQREHVSVASFYQWRRKLDDASSGPSDRRVPTRESFVSVQVTGSTDLQVTFPNGTRLTLPAHDHELVKWFIGAIAMVQTTTGAA
ncbi:MAG: hypothetical protein H6823_03260 [Planctomycetaceae bacterium]|nr:hypothetical protein [Planctomycetaceae bacterium]